MVGDRAIIALQFALRSRIWKFENRLEEGGLHEAPACQAPGTMARRLNKNAYNTKRFNGFLYIDARPASSEYMAYNLHLNVPGCCAAHDLDQLPACGLGAGRATACKDF